MKNIWVPLSGQIAQQRKVETIANNIANANTSGFKKDRLAFKEHLTALTKGSDTIDLPRKEWSPKDFYKTQGGENAFVKVDGSYTNFEQGPLTPTNNPLDLALFGKGFFELHTPSGIRFSRKGNFSISKDGELVTLQGFKVLARVQSTEPSTPEQLSNSDTIRNRFIKINSKNKLSISREGDIFSGNQKVASLSIIEFKDLQAIRKQGSSLYINNSLENIKRQSISTTVNQGFMEGSNVNAIKEMSELINAHRHFENIQKAVNAYDQLSGRIVNDIADFN